MLHGEPCHYQAFPPPGTDNAGNQAYVPGQKIAKFFSEETERRVGLSIKQTVPVGSSDMPHSTTLNFETLHF